MVRLHNDDCLNILKTIPDEEIDLLVTDCPYKIISGGHTKTPLKNEVRGFLFRRGDNKEQSKTGKRIEGHRDGVLFK